ncbi:hypothetical protein P3342_011977 [Pyrenophora teres f. teres]|nr:hypothetical protein P3342_011977 [Pyrenophora teres f. teres]
MGDWQLYRYYGANSSASPPIRPKTVEAKQWDLTTTDALGRTLSASSAPAASGSRSHQTHTMDVTRGSMSSNSTLSTRDDTAGPSAEPFILRHGRRYIRSAQSYPLPCDLPELHRQNLQTLLATAVFGRALGSTPSYPKEGLGNRMWLGILVGRVP